MQKKDSPRLERGLYFVTSYVYYKKLISRSKPKDNLMETDELETAKYPYEKGLKFLNPKIF